MIYSTKLTVTVDTQRNKLIITTDDKRRIAISLVTRTGSDTFIVVDDRPIAPVEQTASGLVRRLCQLLIDKKTIKKLAVEVKPNA